MTRHWSVLFDFEVQVEADSQGEAVRKAKQALADDPDFLELQTILSAPDHDVLEVVETDEDGNPLL